MPINAVKPNGGVVPPWATDGGTRVDPGAGQKATGWTNGQRPAHNVMNWLQGFQCDWLQYFEDATDELDAEKLERNGSNTITGHILPDATTTRNLGSGGARFLNIFTAGIDVSTLIDCAGTVSTADLSVTDDAAFTDVVSDLIPNITGRDLGAVATQWDAFLRDVRVYGDLFPDTDDSASIELGTPALRWRANLARVTINTATFGTPAAGADTKNTAYTNQLVKRGLPKAWGCIAISGGVAVLQEGYNISSVALHGGAPNGINITLATAMADTEYAVCAMAVNATPHYYVKSGRTTTVFKLQARDANTNTDVDMAAMGANDRAMFMVFGNQ